MDPDYFIVVTHSELEPDQKRWLLTNPALADMEAIEKKRVLTVPESLLSSVSHHVADAVETLARQVYPDEFPDDQQ